MAAAGEDRSRLYRRTEGAAPSALHATAREIVHAAGRRGLLAATEHEDCQASAAGRGGGGNGGGMGSGTTMSGGEQTATRANSTCALGAPVLNFSCAITFRPICLFPAERADVLLGVLCKTLPKDMVRS